MAGPSIAVRVIGDLSNFAKSMGDTAQHGESAASRIRSGFSGALAAFNQTGVLGPFGDALNSVDQAIGHIIDHGKQIGPAMMGAGTAVAGLGVGLSTLGSKDQAAHQQLQQSIEATGKSYDDYGDQVEQAIHHQEKYGNTASQTQDALRTMTQAFNDPQKALDELGTASDLAAAKHEDLTTASQQLAKAANGSGRILKELGISQKDATGAAKSHDEILKEISEKLSGQASASADTFSGKIKGLKATIEDNVSEFGQRYGPALTAAGTAMAGLGSAMTIAKGAMEALKNSQILQSAVTKTATAVQWLFNAAMDANPIMLVVIGIGLLVAGFVLAYQHVSWFRNLVQDVFDWIKDHWPLLLAILLGPIGIAIDLIIKNWGKVSDAISWVWNTVLYPIFQGFIWFFNLMGNAVKWVWESVIKPAWDALRDAWSWLWDHVLKPGLEGTKQMWGDIGNAIKWVWENVIKPAWDALRDAASWLFDHVIKPGIDSTKTMWNDLGNAIKWVWENVIKPPLDLFKKAVDDISGAVSSVGGALSHIPGAGLLSHIPGLQHGGIVTQPTVALIGEAGPEAVIPLSRARSVAGGAGAVVNIEHAEFAQEMDVDLFMKRVAWHTQTSVA